MAPDVAQGQSIIVLPNSAVSRIDVGRLLREMEMLDEFFSQMAIRQPGSAVKMPKTSRLMDDLIAANNLNLLQEPERRRLLSFLVNVKAKAPVLHMSFSADPSPLFVHKLVSWVRREIHPLALLHVGLQPTLGAGSILRTTNKHFDFSLRHRFTEKRPLLIQKLQGVPSAHKAPVSATPPAPVPPVTAPPVPAQPQAAAAVPVPAAVAPGAAK